MPAMPTIIEFRYTDGTVRNGVKARLQDDDTYRIEWRHPFSKSLITDATTVGETAARTRMEAVVAFLDYSIGCFGTFAALADDVRQGQPVPSPQATSDSLAALVGNVPQMPTGTV